MNKKLIFLLSIINVHLFGSMAYIEEYKNSQTEKTYNFLRVEFFTKKSLETSIIEKIESHHFNAASEALENLPEPSERIPLKKLLNLTYKESIPGQLKTCLNILKKDLSDNTYHDLFEDLNILSSRKPVNESEALIQKHSIPETKNMLIEDFAEKVIKDSKSKQTDKIVIFTKNCIKNIFSHEFEKAKMQIESAKGNLKRRLNSIYMYEYESSPENDFLRHKQEILDIIDCKNSREDQGIITRLENQVNCIKEILKTNARGKSETLVLNQLSKKWERLHALITEAKNKNKTNYASHQEKR